MKYTNNIHFDADPRDWYKLSITMDKIRRLFY